MRPERGEIWWGELPETGRRPFLVMTREGAIPVLNSVLAAPITSTVRGIPTEVSLGPEDGLPHQCAATMDNLRVVPQSSLIRKICELGPHRMAQACAALRRAVDC